jgi:hypothetical protein
MNDGKVRYWSTTFDQIENADTDPKRIAESLGLDYDPSKEYKLAVIDTADAAKYGDSHTIIPTHEKLGEFAASELKDIPKDKILNFLEWHLLMPHCSLTSRHTVKPHQLRC